MSATSPFPSRRSRHAAAPIATAPATGRSAAPPSESSGGKERVLPSRQAPRAQSRPNAHPRVSASHGRRKRWTLGVGIVGLIATAALVLFGYMGHVAARPPVLSVEGPLDAVTVAGRQGATPVVATTEPVEISSVKMRVETRGSGRVLTSDAPALIAITAFDGANSTNLNAEGTPNLVLGTPSEDDLGPLLSKVVIGQTEGSRLVVARPLVDGGTEIDIIDILYTIASGTAVEDVSGPLNVTFDELGPGVTHEAGEAPAELVVQILNEGTGPQVHADDTVVVQYVAGTWGNTQVIASTWADGSPVKVDLANAMPGLAGALIDQRVGTRLAATVPAEMATGEDTLFMVVDILGRMPTEATSSGLNGQG